MTFEALSNINLVQLNLWLDAIQWVLVLGAIGFMGQNVAVSVVTGRFKENWLKGNWKYLEHHHEPWQEEFPMPTRIWHWINISSFVIFISTGFYIRYPFIDGGREFVRYLHFIAIYAATGAWIYRWGWFMTTTNDWKNFLSFKKEDIQNSIEVQKYYFGLRKDSYEHVAKYHLLQRYGYASMMLLFFPIQAFTGFALIWPKVLLGWTVSLGILGDVAVAAAWARFIHASLMRVFLAFMIVHAGLALLYYFPNFKYFWFGIETPLPHLEHGHGGHGDSDDHGTNEKKTHVKKVKKH